jgi:hypothetical protein
MAEPSFQEAALAKTPIRDLGLTISGTRLEPLVAEVEAELLALGLTRLRPRFYLSTEWGVPMDTIAVAIPFYLAHSELTAMHARRTGHVEGSGAKDILRYLRHEVGHAVNYAYKLYEAPEWVALFGSITQPYVEDYRPEPFSRRFVRHLPGWYAQKHPDEDWAETFAVVATPKRDWRVEYVHWPDALAKLAYCDRIIREVGGRDPEITDTDLDEDVTEVGATVDQFYEAIGESGDDLPRGLDGALRTIFSDEPGNTGADARPAAALIERLEHELTANVYRWTGHFPERTRVLLRHLAERAAALGETYPGAAETEVTIALTTLVTALAMNHVHRGTYLP